MLFDQNAFHQFILDNHVVGFYKEPLMMNSGRLSNWYVNWRDITRDVYLSDKLSNFILAFIHDRDLNPQSIYGVPEGGTKIGVITQYKWALRSPQFQKNSHPLPMGRGKVKDHGDPKDKYFLQQPLGATIVIEDTVTTGTSLLKSIDHLLDLDVSIIAIFVLTDRDEKRDDGQTVAQAITSRGLKYFALSHALNILPRALLYESPQTKKDVAQYFEQYGIHALKI